MAYYERKATRIPYYDYSLDNYYFITICTHNRRCFFGDPDTLNVYGQIAKKHISQIQQHYQTVRIDKYVVMPNHVHLIVVLNGGRDGEGKIDVKQVIAQYKAGVSREIHRFAPEMEIWQRSFHDHIIRNQRDYERIWLYIEGNPQRWDKDCFYINPKLDPYFD